VRAFKFLGKTNAEMQLGTSPEHDKRGLLMGGRSRERGEKTKKAHR